MWTRTANPKNIETRGSSDASTRRSRSSNREPAGVCVGCTEDIKRNQFIIEYVGELFDENECNKRLKEMAARNDRKISFLIIDKSTIYDAGPKGNLARYAAGFARTIAGHSALSERLP